MTELIINQAGEVSFIWDDSLVSLLSLGTPSVRRASHVEPDASGRWTCDLGLSGGPVLGPFRLRSMALSFERDWIAARIVDV